MTTTLRASSTWLSLLGCVFFIFLLVYREYYRYRYAGQIDPLSEWLFVTHRNWSLTVSLALAIVALLLEWRRFRESKRAATLSFLGWLLITSIAIYLFRATQAI